MSYHVNPYFHTLLSPFFFLHAKFEVILKVPKSEDQIQKLNKGFKKGCQEPFFFKCGLLNISLGYMHF
jgi:hypothetical protein